MHKTRVDTAESKLLSGKLKDSPLSAKILAFESPEIRFPSLALIYLSGSTSVSGEF